jgi:hypothetical protein
MGPGPTGGDAGLSVPQAAADEPAVGDLVDAGPPSEPPGFSPDDTGTPVGSNSTAGPLGPAPLGPNGLNGLWGSSYLVNGGSYGEVFADSWVQYQGNTYLFGVGTGDHQNYVNINNSYWQLVQGGTFYSKTAVAPVVYQGLLFLFMVKDSDGSVWYKTFDGSTWSTAHVVGNGGFSTSFSVTPVIYYGRIYLFGVADSPWLHHYFNIFDGYGWTYPLAWQQVPGGGWTDVGPQAAAVFEDRLWLFGLGQNRHVFGNVFDGTNWTGWNDIYSYPAVGDTPTPVVYNNRLHLIVIGQNHYHYVNVFKGGVGYSGSTPFGPAAWTGWLGPTLIPTSRVRDAVGVQLATDANPAGVGGSLMVFSVDEAYGRHYYTQCIGTPTCGGGTDNGDAALYTGSSCTGSSLKITANRYPLSENSDTRLDLSGTTFPDGTPLSQVQCAWVRSGYRLTLCGSEEFDSQCQDYYGQATVVPPKESMSLQRIPTISQPTYVSRTDCISNWWGSNFQSIAASDKYWFVSNGGECAWYDYVEAHVGAIPLTAAGSDFCDGGYARNFGCDAHPAGLAWHADLGRPGYLYMSLGGDLHVMGEDLGDVFVFNRHYDPYYDPAVDDWIAINPVDGLLYSGNVGSPLVNVYRRGYEGTTPYPTQLELLHTIDLSLHGAPFGRAATLRCIQGAAFSPQGFLYLAVDGSDIYHTECDENKSYAGVYVYLVLGGSAGQEAYYETSRFIYPDDDDYEAQAVVLMDTDIRPDVGAFPSTGQIHYAVRNNCIGNDDVLIWHLRAPIWAY